jgi:hypothetical protein
MNQTANGLIEMALINVMTDVKQQGQMANVDDLATAANLHPHTIRKMTNGNRPLSLTLAHFITICTAMKIPFHELMAILPQYIDTSSPKYGLIWDKEAKVFRTGHRPLDLDTSNP